MSHIDSLVTDYVLDLLSAKQRRMVEHHTADCPRCMNLLSDARRREARLTSGFRKAMGPPPGRIEALWPQVSLALDHTARSRAGWLYAGWRDQWRIALAAFGVALMVLVGSFGGIRQLDGWLLSTYTPTLAATPTASLTPALSHTPIHWTMTVPECSQNIAATPAPAVADGSPAPVPPPAPSTLTANDG